MSHSSANAHAEIDGLDVIQGGRPSPGSTWQQSLKQNKA